MILFEAAQVSKCCSYFQILLLKFRFILIFYHFILKRNKKVEIEPPIAGLWHKVQTTVMSRWEQINGQMLYTTET